MGDTINVIIDDLNALFWRLYELPMLLLITSLVFGFAVLYLLIKWMMRKRNWNEKKSGWILGISFVLVLLICGVIVDNKFYRMSKQIEMLDYKLFNLSSQSISDTTNSLKIVSNVNVDLKQSTDSLWEKPEIQQQDLNASTKLFKMRFKTPLASAFLTITDLQTPGLEIVLTPEIQEKYYTSEFGKQQGCFVAINGEAGTTPAQNCPWGQWVGNYIVKNKPLMLKDTKYRPFLAFDSTNKAKYFKALLVDTTLTAEKYNCIGGRWDILVNGEISKSEGVFEGNTKPYPRTIMGINKEGTKLYLLIVDGRQTGYSFGLELAQCATILKGLGAYDAMACDQGGSSCMYLKNQGIISRPGDGEERFTYTHFGLKMKY